MKGMNLTTCVCVGKGVRESLDVCVCVCVCVRVCSYLYDLRTTVVKLFAPVSAVL